jgi:hypothetical protein
MYAVARQGNRWYAVVYEGLDPVTGNEKRSWHPAGTTREEAEQLAARLAAEMNGRNDKVRSLTFGAYLTNTWHPGKRINLAQPPGTDTAARSNGTSIGHRPSPHAPPPCPPPGHALRPDAPPHRRTPSTSTEDRPGSASHHPRLTTKMP